MSDGGRSASLGTRRVFDLLRRRAGSARPAPADRGKVRPRLAVGDRSRARMASTVPTGDLALVAMVLDEGPFLAEWLTFHRLVGFQRVYLYDNGSTDDTRDVVAPFVRDGFVEVIEWPLTYSVDPATVTSNLYHKVAFLHALERVGHLWRWMAFLDADEFLFPAEQPDLVTFLRDYEDLPALVAFWRMFGTSGFATTPEPPIIEHLTMMAPFPTYANTKTIVQPRHVRSISNVHVFDTTAGDQTAHDEHRRLYRWSHAERRATPEAPAAATADLLLLNHYFARSTAEFASRGSRLDAVGREDRSRRRELILAAIERGPVEDLAIQRFVPALRAELLGRA